ncbi:MAG: acyltransferase [Deltaproteobacteria bacterium]|nr:acyltransferase [Deltaproteobacteria bacterium]MBW2307189.1 acyltransferase [Deltaproteobacteria bacterium]
MDEKDLKRLARDIQALYRLLRREMKARWNRDLPLQELLTDRWERAGNLGFGEGTSVYQSAYILWDVKVGEHTWIGPNVLIEGRAPVRIGSYCSISAGVQIYTHDTVLWALSGGKAPYEVAPVTIGDNCHIGAGTIILKGVEIGHHCVVGAASLVNSSLEAYTIAFGIPARPRGRVIIDENNKIELKIEND